ncbi:hypothetical protein NLI96_g258 [Meripilus lineatus]|uniref:Fe2OG dioxygenase domain-containing protein n=1 Tax=Meripilus lineatus TaxID=2056292 RepID=A0AAD5YJG3_9APHY|nr:hypothetical protein NLI96_g258 [Physisporinus lineatus]
MPSMLEKLEALRASITEKAPYRAGVLDVDPEDLILFYGKSREARRIDFSDVTSEDLEHLATTCDPASFGMNNEDVLDESYRKAGKLDSKFFASRLDLNSTGLLAMALDDLMEGGDDQQGVEAEIYKLNVYGEGSFFKAHLDTPRGSNMFGSLVIVFKTPHEGGSLIIRDHGREWTFDSAEAVATNEGPCVAYIAFYSDVEHEVTPVTKGYRVTLTYNLYFKRDPPTEHLQLKSDSENVKAHLQALLDDPSFLPKGGYLGFGSNRLYPVPRVNIDEDYADIVDNLKGSDAVLMSAFKDLSLKIRPRAAVRKQWSSDNVYVLLPKMYDLRQTFDDSTGPLITCLRTEYKGLVISNQYARADNTSDDSDSSDQDGGYDDGQSPDVDILWVNKLEGHTELYCPIATYGNEANLNHIYTYVCFVAGIGPYGARLQRTWKGKNKLL